MTRRLDWPDIPYPPWRETCTALHLYSQMLGKYRLARTPWQNHSWHVTLKVSARGMTTGPVPDGPGAVEIGFDFIDHAVIGAASEGRAGRFPLVPMSAADFHARFRDLLAGLGGTPDFHGRPNELPDPIPFAEDRQTRPYDADAANRFWRALVSADRVLKRFRTGFIGKASPVHFFWGSFDLAVTRFSGRPAPLHPGGMPALPDAVTREAYSHELSSVGFWPGGGAGGFPAFYSYAYPEPAGFRNAPIEPGAAYYDEALGEFLLPYEAVQSAPDPEAALMAFLESTYRAAAEPGGWDRKALECEIGVPRRPRALWPTESECHG